MPSRQFEHLQEASLRRLRSMVPHECPLVVRRRNPPSRGGFEVYVLDVDEGFFGRYEVIAAWIQGYLMAWEATK